MQSKRVSSLAARALPAAAVLVALAGAARADVTPQGGMMRYPDVGKTQIAFVYMGDVWLVPRAGGQATRLTTSPGQELFPKFSPDEKTVAFIGNYEGNRDIYSIPTDGGTATRITYHPGAEVINDWTPDGKGIVYYVSGRGGLRRQTQLFIAPASGGMTEQLPVPYGADAAISPDGTWLAYTPHTIDTRTWKRYRGGMATDIWLFSLKDHSSRQITDWQGIDTLPMWAGGKVYYLSDQGTGKDGLDGDHKLNIWEFDPSTSKRRQVTTCKDFDVKWPSMGPGPDGKGEIVYQCGESLYLLDLAAADPKPKAVSITIPGDKPTIRTRQVDAEKYISDWALSPSAKRVAVEARGEIWSLPGEKGTPRNLTRSSGSAERFPAWSPDGRWLAYMSDATGEYELYVTQSDGLGKTIQVTNGEKDTGAPHKFRFSPVWSPDSKTIAFSDKTGGIYIVTLGESDGKDGLKDCTVKELDRDPWGNPQNVSWSSDSKWVTYTKQEDDTNQNAVWLCNVEDGKKTRVTSGFFTDGSPVFDHKGDYLFFVSARHFEPTNSDLDTSFVYTGANQILAIPLRADLDSPWAPKSDEEDWQKAAKADKKDEPKKDDGKKEDKKDDSDKKADKDSKSDKPAPKDDKDAKKDDDKKADKKKDIKIDLDAMEARALVVPVPPGHFGRLAVNDKGQLIYVRQPLDGDDDKSEIKLFDLTDEKKEEKTVAKGRSFEITADGKKLLVRTGGPRATIQDAAAGASGKPVPTGGMIAQINPREEWKQIFNDAWRIERDFFYVNNMHGVDWNALKTQYGKLIDDCSSRDDVSFVISELISELNIGHAYYSGGDVETGPSVGIGMLGCDFELVPKNGDTPAAYKVKKICRGAAWDADAKGPLSQPGVNVKEGDYLLAVNGVPVDTARDPWAAFQGLAGKVITITVSDKPTLDRSAGDKNEEDNAKDSKSAKGEEKPGDGKEADKDTEKPKKPATGLRDVVVQTLGDETNLRFRDWIESKRAYVEKKTGGKVGYIYVTSTGDDGQSDLFRQFYGQIGKDALIIDERWNSGGHIPTRMIELLNRPVTNYWAKREGHEGRWPPDSHQGPKCMLINGLSGSGGDMFPWLFKEDKLGKVIGTRTWGGLVGISGTPNLIDGANVTAPDFGFYKTNGTWGVEGHGVDPDMVVLDDPAKMMDGGDPQLDAAIDHITAEVKSHPYKPAPRPKDPDRKGMGIRDEDR